MNNLFFWQNIISPHQSSVLRCLSLLPGFTVTLIVDKESDVKRARMGWEIPDIGLSRVIIDPSKHLINELLNRNYAGFHIFSGTRGYPMVWFALKAAIRMKCHIAIMSEPGDWIGFKGIARKWRSRIEAIYLRKKVKCILAIGHKAVQWFELSGYPADIIYDWGYFVELPQSVTFNKHKTSDGLFSIIYVGRLSREKGIVKFLEQIAQIDLPFRLTIIGEGPESDDVERVVLKHNLADRTTFFKFMPNRDVFIHISNADLLVLPSTGKDGWGGVVNEALLTGTPVICSLNCGASVLLSNSLNGDVYDPNLKDELCRLLKKRIALGPITFAERVKIQEWAECISAQAAAHYFTSVLRHAMQQKGTKPHPPWKKKD